MVAWIADHRLADHICLRCEQSAVLFLLILCHADGLRPICLDGSGGLRVIDIEEFFDVVHLDLQRGDL